MTKRKEPWEGKKREARFLLPAFLSAQNFIERETYGYEAGSEVFWFKVATLDFLVAGTSIFLALTTLPIQRHRKYKKSPQLHPKKDTKICYLQYRLQAVINSSDLMRRVPLPSRAFSHARDHLRFLRFLFYGPMLAVNVIMCCKRSKSLWQNPLSYKRRVDQWLVFVASIAWVPKFCSLPKAAETQEFTASSISYMYKHSRPAPF